MLSILLMRKLHIILFSFFFLGCQLLLAQTNLDSLWQATFAMKEDSSKVRALRVLSQRYTQKSADTSVILAEKSIALAKRIGDSRQEFLSWENGLHIYHGQSKLEKAKECGMNALRLSSQVTTKIEKAELLIDLGLSFWRLGQLDTALIYFQESEEIFLEEGIEYWRVYANIGRLYKKTGNFEKAIPYLIKAMEIVEKTDSRMDAGYVMYMIGELYLVQSDFENFDRIVDKWNAFKEAHPSKVKFADRSAHIQSMTVFFDNIENKEAKLREAIAYEFRVGNTFRASNYQFKLGRVLASENRLEEAKEVFLEARLTQNNTSYVQEQKETLFELIQISKQLNQPAEALAWMEKYQALSDSLKEEQVLVNLAELEVKYQTEKKEQALALKSLEASRATLERNLLLGGLVLFGLLAIGFFYNLQHRTEIKRRLAEQQSQLQEQKIERLEQEQKVLSLNAMIEGQEKEQQRIANDLHDSLGGLLTSVKMHFNSMNDQIKERKIYQKTDTLIDEACTEVRRIAHNMMPRALSFSGLDGALGDLVQNLDKHGVQSELEIVGLSTDLPSTSLVMIYRIVQELLNNIVKHAEASHVFIQIFQNADQISLLVEDDGKGFNLKNAKDKKGLGLSSVESRVRFLRGSIDWDSVKGEGTAVNITIPVES